MRDSIRRIYPQVNTPRDSLLKEFEKIMANRPHRFTSHPSKGFLVPPNWTGEEMEFTLIRDNDESFVYVVSIGDEFVGDYFLYYWKKRCLNQEALNKENLCPRFARWTDTMRSSRTGHGGYNPIMRILQEIGINTAETR